MSAELARHVAAHGEAMMGLLRRLSSIQSGTYNKPGVDALARAVAEAFLGTPFTVETLGQTDVGDFVRASSPGCGGEGNILLVGHMDTVFPADTHFTWWREEEGRINAPGSYDMKGGLVVGIFALRALAELGLAERMPLRFFFNSDEEIGSPSSRAFIAEEARRSAMAFVLEGGGMGEGVVTARKGRWGFRLDVKGRGGHAAKASPDKASAITALAHITLALEALTGGHPGVTVNVGRVEGGIGPNSVPETARADVDVRFVDPAGQAWIEARVREIVSAAAVPGTSATVTTVGGRPPMPATEGNRALFRVAEAQAALLGLTIVEEHRSGVSDANFIAAEGVPVLDGLGPVGELDHSDREYILAPTLVRRCQLLALTLHAAWRGVEAGSRA